MYLPKEFLLFNQLIKVSYSRTLLKKKGALGLCDFSNNKIIIQQSTREYPISKQQIQQTFLHEATHMMLDKLGYTQLSNSEKFVDSFANILYQFIEQIEDKK